MASVTRRRRDIKMPLCMSAMVSNDQGRTHKCDFPVFDLKLCHVDQFEYAEFNGVVLFFCFIPEKLFFSISATVRG